MRALNPLPTPPVTMSLGMNGNRMHCGLGQFVRFFEVVRVALVVLVLIGLLLLG